MMGKPVGDMVIRLRIEMDVCGSYVLSARPEGWRFDRVGEVCAIFSDSHDMQAALNSVMGSIAEHAHKHISGQVQ